MLIVSIQLCNYFCPTGIYAPDIQAVNTISELNEVTFYKDFPGVEVQNRVNDPDITLALMDGQGDNRNVISNPNGVARFKLTLADNAVLPTNPKLEV